MGLHALVLYMNADVGILRVVLFTISVLNVSTWFLLVYTIFLMVHIYNYYHFYIPQVLNIIFLVSY